MFQVIKEIAQEVVKSVEQMNIANNVLQDIKELLARTREAKSAVSDVASKGNVAVEKIQQFEARSAFIKDGKVYRSDDLGNIYRCGNELIPNNEYEINGYTYKTDEMGRVVSAEGKAHLKKHEGKLQIQDSKETIGRGDELPTDDKGHIIGDQLDGSNGMENIVAQDSGINQGAYRNLENNIAKAVKEGHDVDIKVEPIYGDKLSYRPTEIKYTYTIDGEKNITLFPNGR